MSELRNQDDEVIHLIEGVEYDPKRITQAVSIVVPTLQDDQKALYALSNYVMSMLAPDVRQALLTAAQNSYLNDPLKHHEEIALEALTGAGIEFAYAQNDTELIKVLDPDGLLASEYNRIQ